MRVLVANDSAERSQGLSHRADLPCDGILLQWTTGGRHPIWMADRRFPLDLVWLEHNGLVAGVLTNVPVCSSQPCPLYEPQGTHQTVAVLELAAGAVDQITGSWNRLIAWLRLVNHLNRLLES